MLNACLFRHAREGRRFCLTDEGRKIFVTRHSSFVRSGAIRAKLLADPARPHRKERQERLAGELRRVRYVQQRRVLLGAVQWLPLLLRADPRHLRLLRPLHRASPRDHRDAPRQRQITFSPGHARARRRGCTAAHLRQRRESNDYGEITTQCPRPVGRPSRPQGAGRPGRHGRRAGCDRQLRVPHGRAEL